MPYSTTRNAPTKSAMQNRRHLAVRRSGIIVRYGRLRPHGYAKVLPQIPFDRFDAEHLNRSSVSAMGMRDFPETFTSGAQRVGSAQ